MQLRQLSEVSAKDCAQALTGLEQLDGKQEFSYPTLREDVAKDGVLHVSYTYKRQTIKHSVVSEAWIRGA